MKSRRTVREGFKGYFYLFALMMNSDIQTRKEFFRKATSYGECIVLDHKRKLKDFDGSLLDLSEAEYAIGPLHSKCLVKYFDKVDRKKANAYSLLKNIRHHNIVFLKNFFDGSGQPRFVFNWVDGSMSAWVKTEGAKVLLKRTGTGTCRNSTIRQLVSGLECLFEHGVYPIQITAKDIYVKKFGKNALAQLLIKEAEALPKSDARKRQIQANLWHEMRDAVKKIFADHVDSPKDMPLVRFLDYIAEGNVKTLQRYPLDWDETEKGKYLLKVLCMNPHKVEQEVNNLIQWPPVTYLGNLPSPLQEMISYDQTRSHPSGYDDKKPYHYLKLCKNIIKHWWLLPESVKVECKTWQRLIQKMERWDPKIWKANEADDGIGI
uniref:Protein kinase domain-containing protein n=1 Tax=Oryza nivara TaxID=4536 RepID=A0A0E0FZD5_ORYNI